MAYPPTFSNVYRGPGRQFCRFVNFDDQGTLEPCRIPSSYIIGGVGGTLNDVALQGNTTQTATASGTLGVAAGRNSLASGANSVALGGDSTGGATQTLASAIDTVAVGHTARATANYSVAVGSAAAASGTGTVAVGQSPSVTATDGIAVGRLASTDHAGGVAIGHGSTSTGGVGDTSAVAVGESTTANGDGAVAIGKSAQATNDGSVAIGQGVTNSIANSVALGANSTTYMRLPPRPNTVTQASANTDTVTVNAAAGQVQMFGTIAAGTNVSFTVNNNTVTSNSLVYVSVHNPGPNGIAIWVNTKNVTSGSFDMIARAISNASSAPTLNFLVLYPA